MHIDCAACYDNEAEVGSALAEAFASGIVRREELFVTSKLWNTMHAPADVPVAAAKTLSDLGLRYLDLYLIHWPMPWPGTSDTPITDTYAAMERLVDTGAARSIGVSSFTSAHLRDVLAMARIPPAVNQVHGAVHGAMHEVIFIGFDLL